MKFMRFSCPSSHSGDMILTVKHNVDTFCHVGINNNLSVLLLCYKRRGDCQATIKIKTKQERRLNCKQFREQDEWRVCGTQIPECDRSHWSRWSIVGWHAALTFTYIICHHFTINPRFMALVNATLLKICSPSSLRHPVLFFFAAFFQEVSPPLPSPRHPFTRTPPSHPLLLCWLGV